MDILPEIVDLMNKEELRFFKLFAHRQASKEERKDMALLDWLRKNKDEKEENTFIEKYYGTDNKNAYYRLKNRLLDDVSKSLVLQHHDDEVLIQLFNFCALVKIFLKKQNYKLALHFLKKAEKNALQQEHYEMLDFIYGEYIKLSHELLEIIPEEFIEKRKKNSNKLNQIRQMDDLLALVSYQLKISQNFNNNTQDLLRDLEKTVSAVSPDEELKKSPKFRIKLYGLISQLFLQKHDYVNLESYTILTFEEFEKDKLFNKSSHDLKLQMLTYIVNASFKNSKTEKSLLYAQKLNNALDQFDAFLRTKYEVFYYNALVNNYTTIDIPKAIKLLEDLLKKKKFKHVPFYDLFLSINLSTSYFDLKEYHKASRQLMQTMLSDSFKNADLQLQFKVNMADLIIRCELKDFDFLNHRIDQVNKDFKSIIGQQMKDKELLLILKNCAKHGITPEDDKNKVAIKSFIENYENSKDENEVIRYVLWLKEKI
jgi:hypothetical protein